MDANSKLRILVLGYVVRRPLGGGVWPTMQYVLGLLRLGHDAWFLEDSEDYGTCYDPTRHVTDEDPTYGLEFATEVFGQHGLSERWAYYDAHKTQWHGPAAARIDELCKTADLVINASAFNPIRPWLEQVPHRAYVEFDPAFEQVRQLTDRDRRARAAKHTSFFTYGENIARGTALVPDDGVPWNGFHQPVVLDCWKVTPGHADGVYTTVMLWQSYPPQEYGESRFGLKSDSFGPYLDLPRRTSQRLEMAVGGPNVPRQELEDNGWSVINPLGPSATADSYQEYLRAAKGEFTVAKHGYVVSRCGWFSERSMHFAASGRPVITQDTGFRDWLPVGEGILTFATPDEALAAFDAVDTDYERHCRAARELAEQYFDSDKVLPPFLEIAMTDVPPLSPELPSESSGVPGVSPDQGAHNR